MSDHIEHFDAVVVGSGFGGSVMTYRLAEAGMKVCLLERGRAYPPNSFPRSPHRLNKNFWDPQAGLYGMFNVWSFRGSGALVSSGLGGGSLIYANVLIRKDPEWFKEDLPNGKYRPWVVQYKDLDLHYGEVERKMNVQECPYHDLPKTVAMEEAVRILNQDPKAGAEFKRLNLAVSFRANRVLDPGNPNSPPNPPLIGVPINEEYENYHSVVSGCRTPRLTCRLCGECDIGCNYGSKNTLDFTYLTLAIHQSPRPDIRTLCEVKTISPRTGGGGYVVEYDVHKPHEFVAGKSCERNTISCKYLILSAGTFGTTYLLMKNRSTLPKVSKQLGETYSVNGDLLSFILNSKIDVEGKERPRVLDPSLGPVITSAVRFPDTMDNRGKHGRGFYIQDGGNPYFLSWLAELQGLPGLLSRSLTFLKTIFKFRLGFSTDADLGDEISDLLGDAASSMSSIPVLAMGRDIPNGRLFLKDDRLDCDWAIESSDEYYSRVRRAGEAIAKTLNADYRDNPSYDFFSQVLTAHPLGGCAMDDSPGHGVVNSSGEVFGYPGLYIADGSVMPGPVGPNPSLTIAALSNRFADHIIDENAGKKYACTSGTQPKTTLVDMTTQTSKEESSGRRGSASRLSFTEEMKGFFTIGNPDYDKGFRLGKEAGTSIMFHLTITVDDVPRFVEDPKHHTEDVVGYVASPALGGRLDVEKARFNLFVDDQVPTRKRMLYRLFFKGADGSPFTLSGFKNIADDEGFDLWSDTTTLFTNILTGHVTEEEENSLKASGGLAERVCGAGIIHIYFFDFLKQLTTFRVEADTAAEKISSATAFGKLFMGDLWEVYGDKVTSII